MAVSNGCGRRPTPLTRANVNDFVKEFDTIVSDIDGVMWNPLSKIPNVKEALHSLKAAGKKILFATNNSMRSQFGNFEKLGYKVNENELVFPALVIARLLKQSGFKKKAYVLGSENFKNHIRAAGVEVVPNQEACEERIGEDVKSVMLASQDDPSIGAVILDVDVNFTYIQLTRAVNFLRRPDCLFYVGASENHFVLKDGPICLGPGLFLRILEEISGRKAVLVGKPGPMMVTDYLKHLHDFDTERSLFVGDTLDQDMGIANACGMKKLLVLTGVTELRDLETCAPELMPDYTIPSFGDLAELLAPPKL